MSRRIKGAEYENKIYFQIERIRSTDGSQTFSAKKTLENGTSRAGCSDLQSRETEQIGSGTKRFSDTAEYFFRRTESQQDLDFSMNDNDVNFKKEKVSKSKPRNTQYSSTKVKARNLLTNVGYRRFKDSDFLNLNFILDILSFLLQNFNPINIDRKVDTEDEQLMINFLWEVCVPYEFATEIYKSPNYQILADPKLTYQKANQIVKKWILSYDKKRELCKKIAENFKSIHYVYSRFIQKFIVEPVSLE